MKYKTEGFFKIKLRPFQIPVCSQDGKRDGSNIMYFATLPVIFGVKKYADALWKVVNERNIQVNLNRNLVEVDGKEAVFENLEDPSAPHQVQNMYSEALPCFT